MGRIAGWSFGRNRRFAIQKGDLVISDTVELESDEPVSPEACRFLISAPHRMAERGTFRLT